MAIEIEITDAGIAKALGVTVEELRRRTELYNRTGSFEEAQAKLIQDTVIQPQSRDGKYRYTAGSSRSGICPICAQYVGIITDGDGTDGVPVPPLHNNCVCSLTPVSFDAIGTNVTAALERRFAWMESLTLEELREVVGDSRVKLLRAGIITVRKLYGRDGLLVPLSKLEIDASTGWLSINQASALVGVSLAGIREWAKVGFIKDAMRLASNDWLIPAEWVKINSDGLKENYHEFLKSRR